MSYANGTTYYNLPQTVGTDKRDWADTNQAFADVDAALHTASETASDAATDIAALQTTVAGIQTDVSGLTTTVNSHTSSIATINETLQLINTALTQLNTNVETKFNSVSIADAYEPTSTYSVGDVVTYAGDRYKCVTSVTTGEPFDADKWSGEDVQTVLNQINNDLIEYTDLLSTPYVLDDYVQTNTDTEKTFTFNSDGLYIITITNTDTSADKAVTVQTNSNVGILQIRTNTQYESAWIALPIKSGTIIKYAANAASLRYRIVVMKVS